eukprot:TRINITY_DN11869_c0_g1_i1.p1 TRINITY_DN11869_c0_g1~~TRINITY_DN11869_c0_g1_i1.p1  ORF type:complete len:316 (-),score=46.24 TRINITY_DN11869_c0_g1_i1:62-1009(-)
MSVSLKVPHRLGPKRTGKLIFIGHTRYKKPLVLQNKDYAKDIQSSPEIQGLLENQINDSENTLFIRDDKDQSLFCVLRRQDIDRVVDQVKKLSEKIEKESVVHRSEERLDWLEFKQTITHLDRLNKRKMKTMETRENTEVLVKLLNAAGATNISELDGMAVSFVSSNEIVDYSHFPEILRRLPLAKDIRIISKPIVREKKKKSSSLLEVKRTSGESAKGKKQKRSGSCVSFSDEVIVYECNSEQHSNDTESEESDDRNSPKYMKQLAMEELLYKTYKSAKFKSKLPEGVKNYRDFRKHEGIEEILGPLPTDLSPQ